MSEAGEDGKKLRAQRLPRWTRQEILVLIEGKRVVERSGRGRGRGRGGGGGVADDGGGTVAEPTKWAAVAAYCRRHGVDRGPVQCRKRWSNLAGDYKKIREWERDKGAQPSFWAMRNDARKERRLPGFFDREVYDILEGRAGAGGNNNAARVELDDVDGKDVNEKPVLNDVGRARRAAADGLFSSSSSDDDDVDNEDAATPPALPTPAPPPAPVFLTVSEKATEEPRLERSEQGTSKRKGLDELTEDSPVQGRQKRRSGDEASGRATTDLQGQLLHILDQSGRMVAAQLEVQNINSRLDREQRKDQASSLLGVLSKMADALYRIADKL